MSEILLQIDGKEVKAREGMTVLEAAQSAGISIPTLLSPRKIGTFWGLPTLHRRSTGRRLDQARCFLRLPGGRKSGCQNQV